MNLVGNVCIRNGDELDYCWRECIASLLPVCDWVCVCDGESTDGTQEYIREWMAKNKKVVLCVYPWPNPKGDPDFWVKWINFSREHIPKNAFHLQLDADEVLSENSYDTIREIMANPVRASYPFKRYNFWKDEKSLIPHGVCCSHEVIRLAPADVWMPSDGPHSRGSECVGMKRNPPKPLEIFHYGFLRKREAWFKKAKALQSYFFDSYDPRLAKAEQYQGNWSEMPGISGWENNLMRFEGRHPALALNWLRERGYSP